MILILPLILAFVMINAQAVIHKRTEYFLDIELSKKQLLIDCAGGLENHNSIVSFHLLDGDTYYFSYYRRVWPMKECHQLQKEYMSIVKYQANARIVISHPRESSMEDKSRKEWPAPFNKVKKMISGPAIPAPSI